MSRFYVPWEHRRPRHFQGPAQAVSAVAVQTYLRGGPLVRRFAGVIFVGGFVIACLVAFLVTVLFSDVDRVHGQLIWAGTIEQGAWASVEQIRAAAADPDLAIHAPAGLIWLFQFSLLRDIVAVVGIVVFVSVLAMFAIWWERKVAGHIQSRLGPMRVGGWHGWSQSLADGLKLICKEDLIPGEADRPLFRLAPYLAFVPALTAFLALPFGIYWVFRDLDVALLFILAMLGIEVMGVLIAGWASNNKWSVYGAMREACQVVSYEIPMGMALLVPVMVAGSLRLHDIAAAQAGGWFNWYAWHSPLTFLAMFVYFVASLASCKRAPFDLPEAESELVAGFHTEYSGFRWSLFFFAEYAAMFIVSGLLVILFLGGWDSPWAGLAPQELAANNSPMGRLLYGVLFSGPIWFVLKAMFLIYVQMWLRWTLPRMRIDQVLYACVQVILPLTMVVLLASVFWELGVNAGNPAFLALARVISIILAIAGAVGALAVLYVAYVGFRGRRVLVGTQAVDRPLAGG